MERLEHEIADLDVAGLAADEAFLVAVKRMGSLDALSREFAREHSGRLWKQLVLSSEPEAASEAERRWPEMLGVAVAAAVTVLVVRLVTMAGQPGEEPWWALRNASLFVLPWLAGWFARRRGLSPRTSVRAAAPFALAALLVNLFPWNEGSSTELLVAAHLPVVLWFAVAVPSMGGRRQVARTADGRRPVHRRVGDLLRAHRAGRWGADGADRRRPGAVVVAAWLVESKQQVVENMAPVLTTIFTPLFALMLVAAAVVYAVTGLGGVFDRELLGLFDARMVVVLGLVLDVLVLGSMVARIGELGFTPNRTAALGLDLVLLVNLAVTAWLSTAFLAGRGTVHRIERWQTAYLPVFALWAAAVVVVLPPVFAFA